jgi:hypothetical protein
VDNRLVADECSVERVLECRAGVRLVQVLNGSERDKWGWLLEKLFGMGVMLRVR